ncbi:MAG TPA: carboxypeptidase regulatory-like domain-containing protein [Pyrinomonadaceae bacterium]|nr:carboxypeptidase regulatory-like domain-containing protein [Pyrinomonadaceae bacterium]
MLSKHARLWLGLIALLGLMSLASSCSKTEEPGETPSTGGEYKTTGNEGSITGKINYTGTAPAPVKIDTSADANCTKKSPDLVAEDWAVKDGKVANTFVYIKDGTLADGKKVGDYSYKPAGGAATLDQNGCHYKPHVMGVMVNQPISITNSDPTTHNVHFRPTKNPDWNQSQPNGAGPLSHKLAVSEVLVPVKCDQHPWMRAFIGVMKHPFFAVSAEDGSFTISGVPPGKYTVVAWHEGPGSGTEKTMEVTVAAKAPATADFTFGASAELRGKPSSMPVVSAVEFPMLRK